MEHAGHDLSADQVRGPAEDGAVVHLVLGRVGQQAGRTLKQMDKKLSKDNGRLSQALSSSLSDIQLHVQALCGYWLLLEQFAGDRCQVHGALICRLGIIENNCQLNQRHALGGNGKVFTLEMSVKRLLV